MSRSNWVKLFSYSAALALSSVATQALEITQVSVENQIFDPLRGEQASVRFNLDERARVALKLYDGRDHLVRVVDAGKVEAGQQQLSWDGLDLHGRPVPAEAYSYTLSASTDVRSVTHDLTDLSGGEIVEVRDVRWDKDTGQIRYHLSQPARVSIRVGLKEGGPLLRTLLDWAPRPAGAQAESWDGWDESQVLKIDEHPQLNLAITAYGLAENTLFAGSKPQQVTFADLPADNQREKAKQRPRSKRMYHHADQPLESRGDLETSLTLGVEAERDSEGRWLVSSKVPLRLDVAQKDRERLLAQRFEPVFYVDGIFAFENEVGFLPMTWQWDSRHVSEGEHFITVNVRGYEGNFGTATLKVWVQQKSPEPVR
ncbi:FlgD immunoglobulin-like domain containing protein [Microbulbifer epialgicus]|uniref:FlgD immunoglobulin-like domain containing protein n=1 Tax=Microbulbifer epialgicus TaxID=393907 RepID=A0ABV4NVE6_9GAMM